MFVHAKSASITYEKVLISSPDTDVLLIALSKCSEINARLYMLTGTGSKKRIIDIDEVADGLHWEFGLDICSKEQLLKSMIGLHWFTGCDTVSAFASKGKVKPLNLMKTNSDYVSLFCSLGEDEHVNDDLYKDIEKFVCHLYGKKNESSINNLRYHLYCQGGGKLACELLPPCSNVLRLYSERANYQARIWKHSLDPLYEPLNPVGHGRCLDDIDWMHCNPAPEEVCTISIIICCVINCFARTSKYYS